MRHAGAEGADNEAALKKRFEFLSQNTNVDCSAKFEASIASMAQDARLQGSCCAPMDETRYRQQLNGLRNYSEIAEVPPNPYDISARLAHKLMGYYDLALSKEETAYDYAMEHSDMQGPCCCECWRWKVYGGLGKLLIRMHHYTGNNSLTSGTLAKAAAGPPIHRCTSSFSLSSPLPGL
jgi:hypothetical protein